MSFEEGSELIDKLGLRVQLFGKDLEKLSKNEECTIFLVVTRPHGDELYHLENLTDPKEMSLLRGLIRCGDPAGLARSGGPSNIARQISKSISQGRIPE